MNLYRNNLKCWGTHSHTWGDASKADLKRRLKSLEFATGLSSLQKITTQVLKNFRCTASTKKNSGIGDHLRMGNKRFHNLRSAFLFSWSHPNLSNIGRAWWHKAAMMTWTLTQSWRYLACIGPILGGRIFRLHSLDITVLWVVETFREEMQYSTDNTREGRLHFVTQEARGVCHNPPHICSKLGIICPLVTTWQDGMRSWMMMVMIYILWWSVCVSVCHEKWSLPPGSLL